MARKYGNISTSSLLKQAEAAQTRQQTYDDSLEAYQYSISAKTDQDYAAYTKYLAGRADKTNDPAKALALQKTINSARTEYQSAQLQRLSTQINYGNASLQDKRDALVKLHDQAVAIGDDQQAQALEYQYTAVDKQIQAEQVAKENAAKAANGGYDTELGAGYAKVLGDAHTAANILQRQFTQGALSAPDFAAKLSVLNAQQEKIYNEIGNKQTLFSADDLSKLADKANSFFNSDTYKQYNAETATQLANGDIGFGVKEVKTGDNTVARTIVPLKVVGQNADGTKRFQTTGNTGSGEFARQVRTPDGRLETIISPVYKDDPSGVPYIVDRQGKRFIAKDETSSPTGTKVLTAKTPDAIKQFEQNNGIPGELAQTASDYLGGTGDLLAPVAKAAKDALGGAGKFLSDNLTKPGSPIGVSGIPFVGSFLDNTLNGAQREKLQTLQSQAEAKAKTEALGRMNVPSSYGPVPLPAVAPTTPAPQAATPVQNVFNSVPRAATPQQTVFNQVSKLIDTGIAANAKSPTPAPAAKPSFNLFNPSTWF